MPGIHPTVCAGDAVHAKKCAHCAHKGRAASGDRSGMRWREDPGLSGTEEKKQNNLVPDHLLKSGRICLMLFVDLPVPGNRTVIRQAL